MEIENFNLASFWRKSQLLVRYGLILLGDHSGRIDCRDTIPVGLSCRCTFCEQSAACPLFLAVFAGMFDTQTALKDTVPSSRARGRHASCPSSDSGSLNSGFLCDMAPCVQGHPGLLFGGSWASSRSPQMPLLLLKVMKCASL